MTKMLYKIIFLFASFCLGCQPSVSVEEATFAAVRDTSAPAAVVSQQSRIMVDRSRNVDLINKNYPFDIPLEDPSHKMWTSDQILAKNGKPTVVLFWLTTCYPCRVEMNAINEKYADWKEEVDFNIVAISTDWDKHLDRFVEMSQTEGWPWKAYRDKDREFRKVLPGGLNGLPQTFIFDKNGEIVYHSRKYRSGDEDKLFSAIKTAAKI